MDKEAVHTHILQDNDLLSDWDDLLSQLSYKKASVLLKEIINLWMTIRGHAFAKQMFEQYKRDKGKLTKISIDEYNCSLTVCWLPAMLRKRGIIYLWFNCAQQPALHCGHSPHFTHHQ